jgi:hypothetical protein
MMRTSFFVIWLGRSLQGPDGSALGANLPVRRQGARY